METQGLRGILVAGAPGLQNSGQADLLGCRVPTIYPTELASEVVARIEVKDSYDEPRDLPVVDKIVGGWPARGSDATFVAAFLDPSGLVTCGGVLVAPRWVLTAAHCSVEEGDLVMIGSTQIDYTREHPHVVKVVPLDLGPSLRVDLALVQLSDAQTNAPIKLWQPSPRLRPARVYGFGATSYRGQASDTLLYADLLLRECTNGDAFSICSEPPPNGRGDACQGDSGGPLVVVDLDGTQRLAGIVRSGMKCGQGSAFYTDLRRPEVLVWIERTVQ